MRKQLMALVVTALAFVLLSPSVRAQTAGTVGIRILDAPTDRVDDPRAKLYIVDHVAPGTTISRRVEIKNDTDEPQRVETYAAAASVKDGAFRFGDGRARNELSTWTTVDPDASELAVGEKRNVQVTIAVPSNASEGERYEVVWASVSAKAAAGGISATNRVGIRVYLSVGPGGEPPSDFEITSLTARRRAGIPEVSAIVKNTGGRALDLSGSMQLTDGPGGLRAGPFPAKLGTTLGVGESESVVVALDKAIPAGPWKASITLESGLEKRTASATVKFPTSGSAESVTTDNETNSLIPIAAGVAAMAVLVGGGSFFLRARRAR